MNLSVNLHYLCLLHRMTVAIASGCPEKAEQIESRVIDHPATITLPEWVLETHGRVVKWWYDRPGASSAQTPRIP